jgi:hypothetical protein
MTDSSGRQLDEIMVVAQKKGRAENLQEVPAATGSECELDVSLRSLDCIAVWQEPA